MKVGELLVTLGLDMSEFDKNTKQAQKRVNNLGNIFNNALSFTLGMGIFDAIKSGFDSTIKSALDFNVMMQNAQIGFTTMLGSAQKAQAFLSQMGEFAINTPFEFPDLLEASKRMMAMGFAAKDVLPTLKAVGDAAAGLGLGKEGIDRITLAIGQMMAKGKVSGEEMRQLAEAGIPAWDILAKAMNKTTGEVMKLSEKGVIPADKAIQALIAGMESRFPNMMDNMQNTWQGLTSAIKDTWRMILGQMTNNLFNSMTNWLKRVKDWSTEFYNAFKQGGLQNAIGKMFGPDVLADLQMISNAVRSAWAIISGMFNFIRANWNVFKPLIFSALTLFTSLKIVETGFSLVNRATVTWNAIMAIANGTAKAASIIQLILAQAVQFYRVQLQLANMEGVATIGIMTRIRMAAIAMWEAITGPVGIVIAIIAAVIAAGVLLYKNWDKVRYYGLQVWGALKIGIMYAAIGIVNAIRLILGWIPGIGSALNGAISSLAGAVAREKNILAQRKANYVASAPELQQAKGLGDNVNQLINTQNQIAQGGNKAADGLNKQADATKKAGKAAQDNIQSFDEIHQMQQEMSNSGEDINFQTPETPSAPDLSSGIDTSGLTGDVSNILDTVKNNTTSVWGTIKDFLSGVWNGIVNTAKTIWGVLEPYLDGLWNGIKTATTTAWNLIVYVLATCWYLAIDMAKAIWQVIGPFFEVLWDGIKTVAMAIWNGLVAFFTTVWNGIVIAAQAIWGIIGPFFNTLWAGIQTVTMAVWNMLSPFLTTIWNGIVIAAKAIWQVIGPFFTTLWNGISQFLTTIWNGIQAAAATIWGLIELAITDPITAAKQTAETITNGLKQTVEIVWNSIKTTATTVWDGIKTVITTPINDAKAILDNIWSTIKNTAITSWNNLKSGIANVAKGIYDNLVKPFDNAKQTIVNIIADAYNWGKDLINNIVNGISSMISKVVNTVSNVANTIKSFLHFSVPDTGPLADADTYGSDFMELYAQSMLKGMPVVKNAANIIAENLSNMTTTPKINTETLSNNTNFNDSIAQAVYQAIMDAFRIINASQPANNDRELVVKIDNTTLARVQLPAIIREGQRQGLNLVVKPQGV